MAQLHTFARPALLFWAFFVTLFLLAVLGGSSRDDAQSLAILSPALALSCGIACFSMKREHWHGKPVIFIFFATIFLLVTMHFVPLHSLMNDGGSSNGRIDPNQVLAARGSHLTNYVWASTGSQTTFFFLLGPLAVTLYAIQLTRYDMVRTLLAIILFGTISGLFGVLQIASASDGPLYLYRITNNGNAVGLFANRNHAAVFLSCMFPMLAAFAAMPDLRRSGVRSVRLIVAAIAILLVPLILVTGSRAGMLTALMGLVGGALLLRSQIFADRRRVKQNSAILIGAFLVFVALVLMTVYFSRALAVERLFYDDKTTYARGDFWRSSLDLFVLYLPFGFGPGLFTQVYQVNEPMALLNARYLNLLHNDWLEMALTFGAPGILLMFAGIIYYLRRSFLLWVKMDGARSAVTLGRMASIIIAILGIASVSDYPLRTPAMAGFAALVLVWFAHARHLPKVD